jgi:L-threonylcarbamoyladenylate synthase
LNEEAVNMIYRVKGRPSDNPLIMHISDIDQLRTLTCEPDENVMKLARAFWPGPLTIILIKRRGLPGYITAGLETIAVRMPAHPVAKALIRAADVPIAAPSANLSGKPSPTSAEHVIADFNGKVDMIIDSGPVAIGLESTVLDMTVAPPRILRPGAVTIEMLHGVIGCDIIDAFGFGERPSGNDKQESVFEKYPSGDIRPDIAGVVKSPGVKYRHYAPEADLILFGGTKKSVSFWMRLYSRICGGNCGVLATDELMGLLGPAGSKMSRPISLGGADKPDIAASRFYGALREFDNRHVKAILCELCEFGGIGTALSDRMIKAAGGNLINADEPEILFVCTGNTCRSAMAEALFKHAFNHFDADGASRGVINGTLRASSAGLRAVDGDAAAYEAIIAMEDMDIDLTDHKAKILDFGILTRSSIILAMTTAHKNEILRRFDISPVRVYAIAELMRMLDIEMDSSASIDISDPYGYGPIEYRACAERLDGMIRPFAKLLSEGG